MWYGVYVCGMVCMYVVWCVCMWYGVYVCGMMCMYVV